MSLLLAHGHLEARHYPLGMVWEETLIVSERATQEAASHTALMQLANVGAQSKEGAKVLKKVLKEMTNG